MQTALTWFVYAIIVFFVLSIVNSLARNNLQRRLEAQYAALDDSLDTSSDKTDAERKPVGGAATRKSAASASSASANASQSRTRRTRLDS